MERNSVRAWVLAARPKTLTGAVAPVLVGGGLLLNWLSDQEISESSTSNLQFPIFLLCLFFAVLMQIDANLVNDYFDWRRGSDRADRLGPERACQQGWVTPRAMRIAISVVTILAAAVGISILSITQRWELLAVGALCIVACFLYTTHLSYWGWGDVLVLLFFGIVPVGFTFYAATAGGWTWAVTLAGLGMGLATDNLLVINNYRDVEQDRISGKRTLIVRFGPGFGRMAYLMLGVMAFVLAEAALLVEVMGLSTFSPEPYDVVRFFLPILYLIIHIMTYRRMTRLTGRDLNRVLGQTAACIFLYGVLLAVAVV